MRGRGEARAAGREATSNGRAAGRWVREGGEELRCWGTGAAGW